MAAAGGFGESPLSALQLPTGGDDELFSPSAAVADGNQHLVHPLHMHQLDDRHQTCCDGADGADISPTYDKAPYMREMEKTIEGSRFCAQHVKNKDKFESVSTFVILHVNRYNGTKYNTMALHELRVSSTALCNNRTFRTNNSTQSSVGRYRSSPKNVLNACGCSSIRFHTKRTRHAQIC